MRMDTGGECYASITLPMVIINSLGSFALKRTLCSVQGLHRVCARKGFILLNPSLSFPLCLKILRADKYGIR